ncbi:MAG TPA: hypothetical protein VI076_06570, partial [Actinopolymorphaceae bacterium]
IWVKWGQLTKLAPRRTKDGWDFTAYFTANRPSTDITVHDTVPRRERGKGQKIPVRVSKLRPPANSDESWRIDRDFDRRFPARPDELDRGVRTGWNLQAGDVLRINYHLDTEADPWEGLAAAKVSLRVPDGSTQEVTSWLPDRDLPGATDEEFPAVAARLVFPLGESRSQTLLL